MVVLKLVKPYIPSYLNRQDLFSYTGKQSGIYILKYDQQNLAYLIFIISQMDSLQLLLCSLWCILPVLNKERFVIIPSTQRLTRNKQVH